MNNKKNLSPELQNLLVRGLMLMGLGTMLCMYHAHANKDKEEYNWNELYAFLFSSLGGAFFVSSLTGPAFSNFFTALSPFLPASLTGNRAIAALQEYEIAYKKIKPNLSESNIQTIEILLQRAKDAILIIDVFSRKDTRGLLKMLDYIFTILNVEKIERASLLNADNKEALLNKLDELLVSYPKENATLLKQKVIVPFLLSLVEDKLKLPSAPVYLLGAPGVGKTWFVNQLAMTLQVPLIKISEFAYTSGQILEDDDIQKKYISPFAKALHYAAQYGSRQCILFIDEFDKILAQPNNQHNGVEAMLLDMLNTDSLTTWKDTYLALDVDLSNVMIMAAGNQKLTAINERYKPISDRMVTIEFKSLQTDNKRNIIFNQAKQMFKQAGMSLSAEDNDFIEKSIQSDKHEGVRQLNLELSTYVRTKKANALLFLGTAWEIKTASVKMAEAGSAEEVASATKLQSVWRMHDIHTAYGLYRATLDGLKLPRADKNKLVRKLGL